MKSIIWMIAAISLICISCKKFVSVPPPVTSLVSSSVYSTNSTAASALTGIFITMSGNTIGGGSYGISALSGLSADELKLFSGSPDVILNHAYTNAILSNDGVPLWNDLYNCIYQANSAITGISTSQGVTPAMSQQLIGEAKFIRAFCYFYLTNLYGDVPLVLTVDYKVNATSPRSAKEEVYQQIIADLKDAQSLLTDGYLTPSGTTTTSRVRPNKAAATALLARVFLYLGEWASAETQATAIINNSNYQLATDLNTVFLAENNTEAIWQLESPSNGFNAPDGAFVIGYLYFGGPGADDPFLLSDSLIKSFDSADLRKANWTVRIGNYYFPYKYKLYYTGQPPLEYTTLFRLAEQYLIRAEARVRQGNSTGAVSDLNTIRVRANLPAYGGPNTEAALATAILHERRVELFTEYGHRWFDLKRTESIDSVMTLFTPLKGGTWLTTAQLFPIPFTEIQADPNLTQNAGYN